jgi:hypothetical protein
MMKLTTDIYLDLRSRGHGKVCILYPEIRGDSGGEANIVGSDSIGYCGEKEAINMWLIVTQVLRQSCLYL